MIVRKITLCTKTVPNRRNHFVLSQQPIRKIQQLSAQGWGVKRISRTLNLAPQTVRKYRRLNLSGNIQRPATGRPKSQVRLFLEQHREQALALFVQVNCSTEVAIRRLKEIYGQEIHAKMFNRFARDIRCACRFIHSPVTERFETAPGAQMQIDFGEIDVTMAGKPIRVHFFVGILGFSRRIFVKAYEHETQEVWLNGIEEAFRYFGGLPCEIVSGNTRSLVAYRAAGQAVRFTASYEALCKHYDVTPSVTAIRKPRSKGKVERAVSYVEHNALVNFETPSMESLNAWLLKWCRTVADERMLSHFKQRPSERWLVEKEAMKPLSQPPLYCGIHLHRKADRNGLVRVENRCCRVPDGFRNRSVELFMCGNSIDVRFGQQTIIKLDRARDAYSRRQQPASSERHDDVFEKRLQQCRQSSEWTRYRQSPDSLKRPVQAYEAILGNF